MGEGRNILVLAHKSVFIYAWRQRARRNLAFLIDTSCSWHENDKVCAKNLKMLNRKWSNGNISKLEQMISLKAPWWGYTPSTLWQMYFKKYRCTDCRMLWTIRRPNSHRIIWNQSFWASSSLGSSSYNRLFRFRYCTISFINNKKRSGTELYPCGTPKLVVLSSDEYPKYSTN